MSNPWHRKRAGRSGSPPRENTRTHDDFAELAATWPALADLITAASAPAHTHEAEDGLNAAVSEFITKRAADPELPRIAHRSPVTVKLAGVKAAIMAVLLIVAGVAAVASIGQVGNPFAHHDTRDAGASTSLREGPVPASPSRAERHTATTDSASSLSSTPSPTAETSSPPPSDLLVKLCRAWQAQPSSTQRTANPNFAPLLDEAGGAGAVYSYCVTLLAAVTGSPSPNPTGALSTTTGTAPPTGSASVPTGTPANKVPPGHAKRSTGATGHAPHGKSSTAAPGNIRHAKRGG